MAQDRRLTGSAVVLANHTCGLWLVRAPALVNAAQRECLGEHELRRVKQLVSAKLRARYVCAHAFARAVLAPELRCSPREVNVALGNLKRPCLGGQHASSGLDFNLSYSEDCIALAVVRHARVGVDLEAGSSNLDTHGLAERVLSPPELQAFEATPRDKRKAFFLRQWTLKEALAKAEGQGLGLPFNDLTVQPGSNHSFHINLDAMASTPETWAFFNLSTPMGAPLSVAIQGTRDQGPFQCLLSPPWPDGDFHSAGPVAPLTSGGGLSGSFESS